MHCRQRLGFSMCCTLAVGWTAIAAAEWRPHQVRQLNGAAAEISIPAEQQIVTESWNRVVAVPYLVYMPEMKRLLMLVGCDYPHMAMQLVSDDQGATWSEPKYLHTDAQGKPDAELSTGLTYLGGGKLLAVGWRSNDYGDTWARVDHPPAANGQSWYQWDPVLVDKDKNTGTVLRLMSFCSDHLLPDKRCEGAIRFSTDQGMTWGTRPRLRSSTRSMKRPSSGRRTATSWLLAAPATRRDSRTKSTTTAGWASRSRRTTVPPGRGPRCCTSTAVIIRAWC